jgi:hypothetical protein
LLNDPDWFALDGEDAKLLIMLWLIASEDEKGRLPEPHKVAFRLRISPEEIPALYRRLSHWLITEPVQKCTKAYESVHAPDVSVQAKNSPYSETETETETEGDLGADAPRSPGPGPETPAPEQPPPPAHPPAERPGVAEQEKGPRLRGHLCPDDFRPTDKHYAAGETLGLSRKDVDHVCARMHRWSHANANRPVARKMDWSLALYDFMDGSNKRTPAKKPINLMDGIT